MHTIEPFFNTIRASTTWIVYLYGGWIKYILTYVVVCVWKQMIADPKDAAGEHDDRRLCLCPRISSVQLFPFLIDTARA